MEKPASAPSFSNRAALLAQPAFFPQRFIHDNFVFARTAGDGQPGHGTGIDLPGRRLFCSCPLHPKPCLHALALHLLYEREGEKIFEPVAELPEWAALLLSGAPAGRLQQALSTPAAKAEKDRQQRRFERLERAAHGFGDLEAWLLDTARRGLATVVSENPQWWEGIAARMADASMGGMSRTLRLLGQIPASAPDWAEQTAAVLSDCYLAVRAFQKRDTLPEALLYDLQNFIGITLRKDDVLAGGEQLHDVWAVLGQWEGPLENDLSARRTWLLGAESGRFALLLDFSFAGDSFPPALGPGNIWQGGLAFYPSAFPQRALAAGELIPVPKKVEKMPGFADFDAFARAYADALSVQPWLQVFPAVFNEVVPRWQDEGFWMTDRQQKSLRLSASGNEGWKLVALSGGHPVSVFGEWDGSVFRVLAVAAEGKFVSMGR